jgi:hypothetical protein
LEKEFAKINRQDAKFTKNKKGNAAITLKISGVSVSLIEFAFPGVLRALAFKSVQPPATIFTISSLSPALSVRLENSDGVTASPLCSTTTLRGNSFCATRNSSIEHGSCAVTGFPLVVMVLIQL